MLKTNHFTWYCIRFPAQKVPEICKLIDNALKSLDSESKMSEYILEISNITYNKSIKRGDKLINVIRPLYPGYLFLKCDSLYIKQVIAFIKKTLTIPFLNILGGEINPSKISNIEYEKMLAKQSELNNIDVNKNTFDEMRSFEVNMTVEIKSGDFEGFNGEVSSIDNDNKTLQIKVLLLGQEIFTKVNFNEVKIL